MNQRLNDSATTESEGEAVEKAFVDGFYSAHINIGYWTSHNDVTPNHAAMLLLGHDPDKGGEPIQSDYVMLARSFRDHAKHHPGPRRLAQWWALALELKKSQSLDYIPLSRSLGEALMLRDAQHQSKTESQAATPAPKVADNTSNAPAWAVKTPQRFGGYAAPLHRLLTAAYRDGNPCPTARDVVEAWRNNAPAEIAKILPDGFDYYDAKGDTKTANLEAIRKAIGRMTSGR